MVSRRRAAGSLHLLTVKAVMAAGEGRHSDGGGLYLAVRPDSVAWVFRFTSPVSGLRRAQGLGPAARGSERAAGESLRVAREQAARRRAMLKEGIDPLDAKSSAVQAARAEHERKTREARAAKEVQRWTLARCARDYHERVIEPTKTAKHSAQWIASLENHIPPELWRRPIADIGPAELLDALLSIRPHERARNLRGEGEPITTTISRIRQRLEATWNEAIFRGRATVNAAAPLRDKLREQMPAVAPREDSDDGHRYLAPDDARRFFAELVKMPGTAARSLQFAILTAARTGEVIGAEWSEFDLATATWRIPGARMKAGKPHAVPLSRAAAELVAAQVGFSSRYVFPSVRDADRPQSNMAMLALLDRMGWRGRTTVHGFRHVFSTWANETAAARPDVIEAALAHTLSGSKVRRAYNKAEYLPERVPLMQAWADFISTPPAGLAVVPRTGTE